MHNYVQVIKADLGKIMDKLSFNNSQFRPCFIVYQIVGHMITGT